jgi:leucine efflux protein
VNLSSLISDVGIINLHFFMVGTVLNIVGPGPTNLIVVNNAIDQGWKAGIKTIAGIMSGNFITLMLIGTGLGLLLSSYPWFNKILIYCGSGFLIWLGYGSIKKGLNTWSKKKKNDDRVASSPPESTAPNKYLFMQGFLIEITNPIAILYYIAYFPQFIDIDSSKPHLAFSFLSIIMLSLHLQFLIFLVFLGYILASRPTIASWLKLHHHWVSGLEIMVGLIFIAYGCRLFLI